MLNENKSLIRRYVEECIGKGDLSLMDELLLPSYVVHMNADNFDLQSYKQFQPSVLAAFPDGRSEYGTRIFPGNRHRPAHPHWLDLGWCPADLGPSAGHQR